MNHKECVNLGAWPKEDGVYFRVWANQAKEIKVIFEDKTKAFPLKPEQDGFFSGYVSGVAPGALYKYQINNEDCFPDPCSRYQPQGPHGPSMVIDPSDFVWHDQDWQKKGIELHGQIIYELHVGTFTQEGTFTALTKEVRNLKELGITVIELMPLAEFAGRWNWGYDGVALYAPAHVYGSPDNLRSFIDEAHQAGLGVILDVVYNHLGPDGNYLGAFSKDYFTKRYENDWGEAINFDGPHSSAVREFFIFNACYWIKEFHFDGLRLDATQNIYDKSSPHILAELSQAAREAALAKKIILIGENEPQDVNLLMPVEKNGKGLDGLLNDDFHHACKVALTGQQEAYYKDYGGTPQEFISLLKYSFLYQGQFYSWQSKLRGTRVKENMSASQFVIFLQNHDQVANSLDGRRLFHQNDQASCRALTALLLLAPQTPYLFMGQEFGASSPFLFFTDHNKELGPKVTQGRGEFLFQFPSVLAGKAVMIDPQEEQAFFKSKLKLEERSLHKEIYQLHCDLIKLRRQDKVFKLQDRQHLDGAVLSPDAFVIRYFGNRSDRLLLINLGKDLSLSICPQPLLAPLSKSSWKFMWSSEEVIYGGRGTVEAFKRNYWNIPAHCTQVFGSGD
jgi:maltooligosyltrehalose trehalohydrolase